MDPYTWWYGSVPGPKLSRIWNTAIKTSCWWQLILRNVLPATMQYWPPQLPAEGRISVSVSKHKHRAWDHCYISGCCLPLKQLKISLPWTFTFVHKKVTILVLLLGSVFKIDSNWFFLEHTTLKLAIRSDLCNTRCTDMVQYGTHYTVPVHTRMVGWLFYEVSSVLT